MAIGNENSMFDGDRGTVVRCAVAVKTTVALASPAIASGSGFDVVVVRGASAGAALASRLSVGASRRVMLTEAGKAHAPDQNSDAVRPQNAIGGDPANVWRYTSDPDLGGNKFAVPQGEILCGSSAVRASVAMPAPDADFERLTRAGLCNWPHADAAPLSTSAASGNVKRSLRPCFLKTLPCPRRRSDCSVATLPSPVKRIVKSRNVN
ncbi:GMC family oxidoreductase N-terminal domain-containing protein [Roseivivax sediminis]|uniref:GMC family oxidoreductase N-terminal domain-containing protein n=1 Tax=Roseivivax sediminis TaxID=936889 RepID=UPI001CB73BB0|nr:GMC family oxidoreductase N-terminal domain-containing protein [Roseivivax sediminis]